MTLQRLIRTEKVGNAETAHITNLLKRKNTDSKAGSVSDQVVHRSSEQYSYSKINFEYEINGEQRKKFVGKQKRKWHHRRVVTFLHQRINKTIHQRKCKPSITICYMLSFKAMKKMNSSLQTHLHSNRKQHEYEQIFCSIRKVDIRRVRYAPINCREGKRKVQHEVRLSGRILKSSGTRTKHEFSNSHIIEMAHISFSITSEQ